MATYPLISVIIPSVKRPHRLWQAMQSVAAQTYPHVEIIVINDAGISVEHLVEKYKAEYGRPAYYVSLYPNKGLAGARNAGIQASHGELIALLDDDDRFRQNHLANIAAPFLEKKEVALTYDDVLILIESGSEDDTTPLVIGSCHMGRAFDNSVFEENDFIPPSTQMFRHDDYDSIGGYDEVIPICEDWDFLLRLRSRGEFVYVPGEIGTEYSFRQNSGDNLGSQFGEHRLKALAMLSERYHLPPLTPKTFLDVARDLGFKVVYFG